jgi:hypothetical protein
MQETSPPKVDIDETEKQIQLGFQADERLRVEEIFWPHSSSDVQVVLGIFYDINIHTILLFCSTRTSLIWLRYGSR